MYAASAALLRGTTITTVQKHAGIVIHSNAVVVYSYNYMSLVLRCLYGAWAQRPLYSLRLSLARHCLRGCCCIRVAAAEKNG
jgi:hypothetical protein